MTAATTAKPARRAAARPGVRPAAAPRVLRKRALRLEQDARHPLYLFSLTPGELFRIADVSRVSRDDAGKLIGYQRPEVKRHVQDIVEYLNSDRVLFPNSLILALSDKVRFIRSRGPQTQAGDVAAGVLEIRVPADGKPRPAWIVDGQQRALALSKSARAATLSVPVNAFVADGVDVQRDQFLRVNNTKPLPRGLITELLPEVTCPLPSRLAARRIPAALADLLARHDESPFKGLVRRSSDPPGRGRRPTIVAEQSLVRMLEDSLNTPGGCLFPYRNAATNETDFDGVWAVVSTFWNAVRVVFPDAWGLPPTRSRLMHGVGIRAMGRLMDRVMAAARPADPAAARQVRRDLEAVRPHCRWTEGQWEDLGGLAWNDLQNVPRHIHMLSNHLVRLYVQRKDRAGQ